MTTMHRLVLLLAFVSSILSLQPSLAAEPPAVTVTNIRRVFHNGEHNAFTDLVRFKGPALPLLPQLPGRPHGLQHGLDDHPAQHG
jgi:hypothetical protein